MSWARPSAASLVSDRGPSAQLIVTVDEDLKSSTELRILAHAKVPSEGEWTIPGLRPLDAIWTGGTTTVFLDQFHVMKECREKPDGLSFPRRRMPVRSIGWNSSRDSPSSVAQLVFHRPRADRRARFEAVSSSPASPARLECRVELGVHNGSMPELAIDLSPEWLPEQVTIRGMDDPVAWHPSCCLGKHEGLTCASRDHDHAQEGAGGLVGPRARPLPGGRGPTATSSRPSGRRPVER